MLLLVLKLKYCYCQDHCCHPPDINTAITFVIIITNVIINEANISFVIITAIGDVVIFVLTIIVVIIILITVTEVITLILIKLA